MADENICPEETTNWELSRKNIWPHFGSRQFLAFCEKQDNFSHELLETHPAKDSCKFTGYSDLEGFSIAFHRIFGKFINVIGRGMKGRMGQEMHRADSCLKRTSVLLEK